MWIRVGRKKMRRNRTPKNCIECNCLITRQALRCKTCSYKHKTRPKGLIYIKHKENPGSFVKGQKPWNYGKVGVQIGWNKGVKGTHFSPRTEFTPDRVIGEKNYQWKGANVGYHALHGWITRNYGKASRCENINSKLGFPCKKISKNYDWAFINKEGYARDRNQYMELCHSCHMKYDKNK